MHLRKTNKKTNPARFPCPLLHLRTGCKKTRERTTPRSDEESKESNQRSGPTPRSCSQREDGGMKDERRRTQGHQTFFKSELTLEGLTLWKDTGRSEEHTSELQSQ